MATPQHGIFAVGTRSQHHLQFTVGGDATENDLLAALRSIRDQATTIAGVNVVVGLGAALCSRLMPEWLPQDLVPFEARTGPSGVTFPAEQHDLWLWLHSSGPDGTFDVARRAARCLHGLGEAVAEQPCFTYQASRDLTGFEDGTENPPIDEAPAAATIPAGAPGAGGSVVLLQRWVHDLDGFEALDADDQSQIIGRDKVSGEELPEERRSPRAHISRVVLEDADGAEVPIFRRSAAFGGVLEHGLMFLAFSADVDRLDRMLDRMLGAGDDVTDALTDISTPSGSAWYVAPPIEAFR